MTTSGDAGLFPFLNEIAIIHQLASALFVKALPHGVHISHFAILNHMVRLGDNRTPMELASAMQVTKATMSHSLKVLKARDFIAIHADPVDGRVKRIVMTQRGRQFREEAILALDAEMVEIAAQLDGEIMLKTIEHLRRVRRILDRARSS